MQTADGHNLQTKAKLQYPAQWSNLATQCTPRYFANKTQGYTQAHIHTMVNESKLHYIRKLHTGTPLHSFMINTAGGYGRKSLVLNKVYIASVRVTHKIAKYNILLFCIIVLFATCVHRLYRLPYKLPSRC